MPFVLLLCALLSSSYAMPNRTDSTCIALLGTDELTQQTEATLDRWRGIERQRLAAPLTYEARRRVLTTVYQTLPDVRAMLARANELAREQNENIDGTYRTFGKLRPRLLRPSRRAALARDQAAAAATARVLGTLGLLRGYLHSVRHDLRRPIEDPEFSLPSFAEYVRVWSSVGAGLDLAADDAPAAARPSEVSSPDHESDALEGIFEETSAPVHPGTPPGRAFALRPAPKHSPPVYIIFPGFNEPGVVEHGADLVGRTVRCRGTYLPDVSLLIHATCEGT